MLRRTPVLAVLLSLAITFIGMAPSQATAPDVTAINVSDATIYPSINTADRPGTTTITIDSTDLTSDHLEVRKTSDDTLVNTVLVSGGTTTTWNGRDSGGALVPAGAYTLIALNSANEAATTTGTVTVSRQHLIRKTLIRTSAANKYVYKFVGKCSTLRKPSKRGWAGSLGYYANTKCKTQTWDASKVITLHETRMPAAERYIDVRIDTYGGAAKAKPRSRGLIEYWSETEQTWDPYKFIGSKVSWHNGPTRSAGAHVDANQWLGWRFDTAFKSQYDVKQFRVVVHYDVLSAS